MPLTSPVAFPLFGILPTGACACGSAVCARVGKHPEVAWGEISLGDEVPRPEEGAGVGLKTGAAPKGSGVFVVDIDGAEAWDAWRELEELGRTEEDYADDRISTFMVETGRVGGGWQLYFQHPGFHVKNSTGELAEHVDIRGDGGFVVGPGSPHKSGKSYGIVCDVDPAPAPAWLLEWLRARPAAIEIQSYPGDVTDPDERAHLAERYVSFLKTAPPCVEGQAGDQRLFEVVQRGAFDLALPTADVLDLVRTHFDPRCVPPWGEELEERVIHKAHTAKTASTRPRTEPIPASLAAFLDAPPSRSTTPAAPAGPLAIKWGGWNDPIFPPEYLLEGLIPEGKVCVFYAEGGSVKSWTAFGLALAVASGTPFLGKATKKGRALILDFEDGRYEFQRRRPMLMRDAGDVPDLGYLYYGPRLNDPELWKALVPLDLRLLVVDALNSSMPTDVDENDSAFSEGVKMAGIFTEAMGGKCTVVMIAHANKQGGLRGASASRDQSDVVFRFEAVSETDNVKRMRMVCDKPGPQKKPPPVNVQLSDAGLETFEDEAMALGRNATTDKDIRAAILLALAGGPIATQRKIRDAVGCASNDVSAELQALVKTLEVIDMPPGGYQLDDEPRRVQRVLACLRTGEPFASAAKLGNAAYVDTEFVETMIRRGSVTRSAEGRLMGITR